MIAIDKFNYDRDRDYRHLPNWQQAWGEDFPRECKRAITHEFGHGVGMCDLPSNTAIKTIMDPENIDCINLRIYPPHPVFAPENIDQSTVKEY